MTFASNVYLNFVHFNSLFEDKFNISLIDNLENFKNCFR